MAKTQDLKRRIRSVRNTMQVTKAMKMVSAARLRRAQERIVAARPFAARTLAVLRSVASRANAELHPLLQVRPERKVALIVLTGDRGLCGSFNSNIQKKAASQIEALRGCEMTVSVIGKKGREYVRRRKLPVHREWTDIFRRVEFQHAAEIGQDVIDRYTAGAVDSVYLIYNEFKSAIQQFPVIERLLPIAPEEVTGSAVTEDYIYEPGAQTLFEQMLPGYVRVRVFNALLESAAAEHAARMTAMESATNNARDLIDALTLRMNRVRQASITTEIIEVVSGAQALG